MGELKGTSIALSSKRLLMGLLGYSVKAQVSKESSALLKTIQHEEAGFQARNNTLHFALMSTVQSIAIDVAYQDISPGIVAASAAAETLGVIYQMM